MKEVIKRYEICEGKDFRIILYVLGDIQEEFIC